MLEFRAGRWLPALFTAAAIALTLLAIAITHHLLPASLIHLQFIWQRLYYLPIILAALRFGWRGGLLAALLAGSSYFVSPLSISATTGYDVLDQYLEVMMFCIVGAMTGALADLQEKQKAALERTTSQLRTVYRELQDNFERMKRAERLYAIGQLSAGLAHEIRNPLAGIEGSVAVLRTESESPQRRLEFLDIIEKECRRLNRMLTNFLDFAKPRQPQIYPADVDSLIDSTISLSAHAARPKPVTVRKEVPSPLPALECDSEQIKQVLLNLTLNAIQSMPGGGEIVLSAREANGQLQILVQDQGCGIRSEDRDRIFDPFFTTKDNGTGLGLSIAHQIIAQHGGILTVEQGAKQGSTFTITLPVQQGRVL